MTSQATASSSASSSSLPSAKVAPQQQQEEFAHDDIPNILDPNRWFFVKEQLEQTPSRRCGIDADKELTYRQQSANFIQDMGQRLQVNQLCINTAIVYMHRFYMYHSFSQFHRNHVSTAAIFLAAKVEEQPRKLEHVIKVAHFCLSRDNTPIDVKSEAYTEQTSELVITENILLQTLGFDVAIDHPHTHVVKCCQLVRASKDLAQTSYFMATNSLHLTTMCLQYKPTVVACVCIHLTCKWSNWEIPRSKEGRDWFWYVDQTVTMDQLEKLTTEFLAIFDKFPSRLKKKIMSLNQSGGGSTSLSSFPTNFNLDPTSPGAPQYPVNRCHSPGMSAGMFGNTASSSLGKRPSSSLKPSGAQVSSKQGKMNVVNGGLGSHHSSKSSSSSSSSHGPPVPSSNSSKHYPSGNKILPPHHKDPQQQHAKGPGGHHSSHGQPYHGQNRPSSGSSTSISSSSSHSHPSGHHSSSGNHPSSGQLNKIPSHTSSHAPGMGHSSSSKSQHNQPSKPPYGNFNVKSQTSSSSSSVPPQSLSHIPPSHKSTSSSSASTPNPVHKVPTPIPPPQTQQQQQSQPPFNQIKKQPYQETLRRSTGTTSSNNSNNLSNNNGSSNVNSSNAGVNKTSLPFNSMVDSIATATTTSSLSSSSSRLWGDPGPGLGGLPLGEPRLPTGRTSSLFSPEIAENSFPPIQPFLKNDVLSPIGGDVGANNNTNIKGSGGSGTDFLGDNSYNSNSNPPAVTASLFPNLTQFDFGTGGTGGGRSNNSNNNLATAASEISFSSGIKTIKTEDGSVVVGNNNNDNGGNMHGGGPPEMMMSDSQNPSTINPLSTSTLSSKNDYPIIKGEYPIIKNEYGSSSLPTPSSSNINNIPSSSLDMPTTTNLSNYLPQQQQQIDIDNSGSRIETPHKKSKKNKKEKHKHKDKTEKKDKDAKKHKDKSKDKEKNKEEKKHREKGEKEKHKKDKHRDKDKSSKIKYHGDTDHSSPMSQSSLILPSTPVIMPSSVENSGNRIKMTIPKTSIDHHESHEKSSKSSKHVSKPKHSSKSRSSAMTTATSTPTTNQGIKLKIAPVRPPSNDVYISKPNN